MIKDDYMKPSEVDDYSFHNAHNYKLQLRRLSENPSILNWVEDFVESIRKENIDDLIQELHKEDNLSSVANSLGVLYDIAAYGSKVCEYIDSYKGWYRLTKDVEVVFDFSCHNPYTNSKETVVYKKGSYIKNLKLTLEDYREYAYSSIPEDAVEKVDFNPSTYIGKDGEEYFADWGKWDEQLQKWEFEDDPIQTGDRVYY